MFFTRYTIAYLWSQLTNVLIFYGATRRILNCEQLSMCMYIIIINKLR